jgi:vacuolar protein-sorting-associated protein 4
MNSILNPNSTEKFRDGAGGPGAENDKEEEKLNDALSSAIVKEKPNVKWTDVAGLD